MSATEIFDNPNVDLMKGMVRTVFPHLKWRWHGIGVLQAYVFEGDYEARVHIWANDLMLPGIDVSGDIHNHRFKMRSHILVGELEHHEYDVEIGGDGYDVYDFVHAREHTNENRSDMRLLPSQVGATVTDHQFCPGESYTFERGAFHRSSPHPTSYVVVTLVEKMDQRDERAKVLAPHGKPPVPAFSGGSVNSLVQEEVLAAAKDLLR